jgi:RNA polymerase sigma factor (sigma-70 family)
VARGARETSLRHLRTLFQVGTVGGLTDGQLLERFTTRGGDAAEQAFEALIERHGPMVLRVCRRVLADPHAAEDAFQATFLVLVRRARSIRDQDSVGSWLHGVALRVAAAARVTAARRRIHEEKRRGMAARHVEFADPDDLGRALHEEVGRLPARYRGAVVLCYLEGHTYEEAAVQLRCPVGTVRSRLAWARQRLRDRLVHRGLAPTAGAFGVVVVAETASSAVPTALTEATVQAALRFAAGPAAAAGTVSATVAALTEGVLKAMLLTKLKLTLATALILGVAASGMGVLAQDPPPPAALDGDRLRDLEQKLDRVLKAVENPNRATNSRYRVERDIGKARHLTQEEPVETDQASDVEGIVAARQFASTVSQPAPPPLAAVSQPPPPPHAALPDSDRLGRVERKLELLEARIEQLERRVAPEGGRSPATAK